MADGMPRYTLRAARKLVGPAAVQATHIYNENTQSIEPVGTQQ